MKGWFLSVLICCCGTAAWGQQSGLGRASISIPGVSGALQLDAGPTAWEARVRPDGKEVQLQAMGRPDHLLVSAFLQRVSFAASADECRDQWWPGTEKGNRTRHMKMDHLQKSSDGGVARVEFILPEFQGYPVRQKTVHVYLGNGNLCAEIHLSKVNFTPADQKLFDEVVASARLSTVDSTAHDQIQTSQSTEYFAQASQYYMQHKYADAADRYQKVLDLEKKNRTLGKDSFRVLIDNLGMSYGISGDLSKAKETFAYGISQDPDYPLFYYNMACTYAEMSQLNESLEQLRMAYKYKGNLIAGESLPDPLRDDSFRQFVKDPKFIQAVHELQR